ncbi:MAG: DUF2799 domain-containing protein [Gammaproteobacteria bacterium]
MIPIILSVAGCATMDKDECLIANWRLIGFQDGVQGKSAATIGTYRKDCADYHVAPDLDAYQAGRREGLLQYCVPANGYRLGVAGRAYNAVCPAGMERSFRAAYNTGHDIYQARTRVNSTASQINHKQQAIQSLEADRQDKLAEMIRQGLSSEQRVLLLYDVTNIEKDIHTTNTDISVLERDLEQQRAQLDYLLNISPY